MTSWFTRRFTGFFNFYDRYGDAQCMNDYTSYKGDIEREIDKFDKKNYANYYHEWEKLNNYITEKNNKLKECYTKRYITGTLIEDDKIKNFMNRCSSNRRCNNPSRQALRTPSSNPETKRSCKGPNDCKETEKPKEAKPNPNPTSPEVVSKTKSSGRQDSDDQGQSHVNVPGSRTGSLNLQSQTGIGHSVSSVVADNTAPEQRDNTHSGVSGQTETQTQSASASALKKENILDPHPRNASSQSISDGGSLSISTTPLIVLETNNHQGGPHGNKDLSGESLGEHATGVESVEGKSTSDKDCAKTSCPENLTGGTPGRGENVDGHSQQIVANSVVTDRISVFSGDSVSVDLKTANYDKVLPVHLPAGDRDANPLTPGCENSHGVNCQSKVSGVKPTEENPESDDAVENPRSGVSTDEITCVVGIINNTSSWKLYIDKKNSNIVDDSLHSSYECDLTFTVNDSYSRATSMVRNNDYKYLCYCKKFYKIYRMYHLMDHRLLKNIRRIQKQKEKNQNKGNNQNHANMINWERNNNYIYVHKKILEDLHPLPMAYVYHTSAPISEDNSERNKLSEQYGVAPDMDTKESATTGDGIELHESSLNRYLILYKNYIIMALISLVVILLLTILLKCTPLGTLFTKKKKKKRKQMNEKLQRVLVEPSNAREERNIQFAYSAFEYLK
ncbi:unnamed protein product [Plasmodium vivax]|uniref:(malaria parasite P. vivax) hypothetical protein n=1 Tax=Plasmodium vivax TaxID=5855 RepID=A0A8S4H5I8_PLAVI|nr:unnamed protein product [Plasmodium vivax]